MSTPKSVTLQNAFERLRLQLNYKIDLLDNSVRLNNIFTSLELAKPVLKSVGQYFKKKCKQPIKIVFYYRNPKRKIVRSEYMYSTYGG